MTSICLSFYSEQAKQVKDLFREKEQDSLLRHTFRQAILVSPCVFSVLPFINVCDRRFKILKIPIASTIVGVAACALGWLKKRQKTIESKGKLNSDDKIRIETNRFVRNFIWKTICRRTVHVLIHELGHYFAALALLDTSPAIEIFLEGGGVTTLEGGWFNDKSIFTEQRAWLGKKIDGKIIEAIIAGAGPGFQAIHVCAELFSAFLLKKSHPEASDVFRSLAMHNIARLGGYPLMGLGMVTNPNIRLMLQVADLTLPIFSLIVSPKTANMASDICMFANHVIPKTNGMGDFDVFRDYGIHPLVCFSSLVAIPLAFQLSLIGYNYFSSKNNPEKSTKT